MAKATEHGRIIAAAAKAALAPLGCVRRGQSRIWQDDHRYWAINVEFQPSGWSKGSYLNIHVAWLWAVTHGYQFSYRAGSFIPFETVEQFTPLITEMATTAAVEVQKTREKFRSFDDILTQIQTCAARKPNFWDHFDAAIAHALAGDIPAARQYFERIANWNTEGSTWRTQARQNTLTLATLLDRPRDFRSAIVANIARRRQLMYLPPTHTASMNWIP